MYIRSFRVRNYMIHQNTVVELSPVTVFVGQNGGGKSAFFDAMLNFSMLSRGHLRQAFGPYPWSFRSSLYRGASNPARIGFEVAMSRAEGDDEWLVYGIDYAQKGMYEDQPAFTIFSERLTRMPTGEVLFDRAQVDDYPMAKGLRLEDDRSFFSACRYQAATEPGFTLDPLLDYLTQQISRFNKFRLDPTELAAPRRRPEVGGDTEPAGPTGLRRMGYLGEDLAAILFALDESESPHLKVVVDRIQQVVPEFEGFDFVAVGTDRVAFDVRYRDRRAAVPAARLSSGMLIYIGLTVLVTLPSRPPILMIEEPENGLTPEAIKAFYQSVRALAFHPDPAQRSQVLISSHSPLVICEAWNGEDRNFIHQVKVADGKSLVRRFADVVESEGIQLGKDESGARTVLSLKNAENIMSGYMS